MESEFCDFYTFSKDRYITDFTADNISCINLRRHVQQIVHGLRSKALTRRNCISNDIHKDLFVSTNKNALCELMNRLLKVLIENSTNRDIHVSVKVVGNVILVHIRGGCSIQSKDIISILEATEELAERIGGCVTMSNDIHGFAVAFTFINN